MCYFDGHIKELGAVNDIALNKLTERILSNDYLWDQESKTRENNYLCFDETRHIVFKFPVNRQDHTRSKIKNYIWDDGWKDLIKPIIDEIVKPYGFKKAKTTRIMLANIMPGGAIGKHIDNAKCADVPHKIHVPLKTDDKALFFEDDSTYNLKRGFAYEVNNKIMHGVHNGSTEERIHLIFDFYDAT